ncbi:probable methyltransferase PMT21 isoform X1 [Elaeis guineensis]
MTFRSLMVFMVMQHLPYISMLQFVCNCIFNWKWSRFLVLLYNVVKYITLVSCRFLISEYKMKNKDPKPGAYPDKSSGIVPMTLMFIVLCGSSFYLGGIFCSEKVIFFKKDETPMIQSRKETVVAPLQIKSLAFPECSSNYQDYTPCTDPKRWRKYGNYRLSFMERHCPPMTERNECLVPPPDGYKPPIRWPKSRDECWYRNVPYDWINNQKSNQHWLRKEGEKFYFPGGGTMFPNGVGAYVDLMQKLIPGMKDGTVRTAIDTGCGVASWGGDLLDRGILTVSLAPRDNHEAQVQFALERGIPAILGIISTQHLPFPSNSFDMAHCSRCLIPWTEFGGIYLLEIHRILRPGGFWVLSGPPINYENRWRGWNTTVQEQKADFDKLKKFLASMCFKLYSKKDDIAVWQKSPDNSCYNQLTPASYPPKCDDSMDPDSAWYVPLRSCIATPNQNFKKLGLQSTPKWPNRLHIAPERVSMLPSGNSGGFKHDDSKWKLRVKHYKTLLPALGSDKIRNVMDMNTLYGGFAAALISSPVWVMNVVSSYGVNSLGVVYDRGLIGTYHDWCEAFSTYPRTYDLLHLDDLFTAESHRCEMKYVLLEMDRILRPNGYVIVHENNYFIDAITTIAKGMRWNCQKHDTEYNVEKEKLLICQKKLWYAKLSQQ